MRTMLTFIKEDLLDLKRWLSDHLLLEIHQLAGKDQCTHTELPLHQSVGKLKSSRLSTKDSPKARLTTTCTGRDGDLTLCVTMFQWIYTPAVSDDSFCRLKFQKDSR